MTAVVRIALAAMQKKYQQDLGALRLLEDQRDNVVGELAALRDRLDLWQQVQLLFQKTSEFAREQIRHRIEATVTAALQATFDEPMEFRVTLRELHGQPAAEFTVVSRYGDVEVAVSPEDARGGGVVDVVSLALRLAVLELHEPRLDGPLVLDEPGKMISAEYAANLAFFLRQYAAETGRQVILVTHNPVLIEAADRSYRVTQKDGVSEVVPA